MVLRFCAGHRLSGFDCCSATSISCVMRPCCLLFAVRCRCSVDWLSAVWLSADWLSADWLSADWLSAVLAVCWVLLRCWHTDRLEYLDLL